MSFIILLTVFLCVLVETILLGWNFWGIFVCLIIIAAVLLRFLGKRQKWISVLTVVLIVAGVLGVCLSEQDSYVQTYGNELNRVNVLIDKEKTEEALEILDDLEEDYGLRDEIVMARITCHFHDGDYDEALEVAQTYPNKDSQEYYSTIKEIYKEMEEDGKENLDNLYLEAANKWPNWLEMQLSAGMVQLERKEYSSAQKYFERAYYLDYENGMSAYLLGMTAYYMGDYKNCLFYYNDALKRGVSDEIKEAIVNQVAIVQEDE